MSGCTKGKKEEEVSFDIQDKEKQPHRLIKTHCLHAE